MTTCDRDRRAVATTPPSSLVRFATTKLMRPMTYRRSSIKFCGSNSSFERWNISLAIARILQYFTILYSLSLLSFYVRLSFFFFFSFSPLVPCLLLGRVTNYSPRPSKNLISNSPYLWSHRLNISLQTPLSVPLFHAVFSPRSFSSLSRPETLWRERRRDKKGGPCKVIRSDIRKFNRNYATERIQSECRLPKNQ